MLWNEYPLLTFAHTFEFTMMVIFISGIPVPIVAISAGIAHDHYGNDEL